MFEPSCNLPESTSVVAPRGAPFRERPTAVRRAPAMACSVFRRAVRRARGVVLRHEPLEGRLCLSADTSSASTPLDWQGHRVDVRRDAWIVRAVAQATESDLRIDTAWRATSLGE